MYEASRAIHASMNHIIHMIVHSPTKPEPIKTIFQGLKDPIKKQRWKEAAFQQFDKNNDLGIYSKPIAWQELPDTVKPLPSTLAPKISKVGDNLYEYKLRHCLNGSSQQQGIDYDFSYSPTAGAGSVKSTCAFSAAHGMELALYDT
jgi:hypothetical protein